MEMQHIRQKQIVQVNNAEVWTLGRLVHDCIFLFSYAFIFFGSVFRITDMLKNEAISNQMLSRWYWIKIWYFIRPTPLGEMQH